MGAVVLYHAGIPFLPGGYIGVDIFFVISGFLITSHLLSQLDDGGKIAFADFYARRARRILPASFFVLVGSIVAAVIWMPPLLLGDLLEDAMATASYVPNLIFAVRGTNYLAESTPSLFQHYWSLGVEEQFYLAWPLALFILFRVSKTRRGVGFALISLGLVSFVASVALLNIAQPWAFFSMPTRAWEFVIGGLVAFYASAVRSIPEKLAALLAWAGVLGLAGCILLYTESTPFPGFAALGPALATALVIAGGMAAPKNGPARLLSLRPFLFIGVISYSLYLVHWPLLVIPQAVAGYNNELPIWLTTVIALACVPLAYFLFRFVEEPGRTARWLARARARRSLIISLVASAATVVLAFGTLEVTSAIPLHSNKSATATVLQSPPTESPFVPKNLTPGLREASHDNPVLYADGCQLGVSAVEPRPCAYGSADDPTIVLFGDSHAAQWFPAVYTWARSNGYRVETHTKESCPSVSIDVARAGVAYTACSEWRKQVLDQLESERPALVVVSNFGKVNPVNGTDELNQEWASGLETTVDRLNQFTQVLVVADVPDMGQSPSICLSAHLESAGACDRPRDEAIRAATQDVERSVAERTDVGYADLTKYFCGPDSCPSISGTTLIYRDAHHITATFSEALSQALGDDIAQALAG